MRRSTCLAMPLTSRAGRLPTPARASSSGGRPLLRAASAAVASTGRSLGGGPSRDVDARSARVGVGEDPPQEGVGLLGLLDLRDVPAAVEDDLVGARQPLGALAPEGGRD